MSDREEEAGGDRRRRSRAGSGESGLAERVEQAAVIPEWPTLVGPQIAAVTSRSRSRANGTLFVRVTTNAWMNELSLLEPELLRSLNAKAERAPVRRIRWLLAMRRIERVNRCRPEDLALMTNCCIRDEFRVRFYRLDPTAVFGFCSGLIFHG